MKIYIDGGFPQHSAPAEPSYLRDLLDRSHRIRHISSHAGNLCTTGGFTAISVLQPTIYKDLQADVGHGAALNPSLGTGSGGLPIHVAALQKKKPAPEALQSGGGIERKKASGRGENTFFSMWN